jgi:hypothetical protein
MKPLRTTADKALPRCDKRGIEEPADARRGRIGEAAALLDSVSEEFPIPVALGTPPPAHAPG